MAEYINRTAVYETVCKGCTRKGDVSGTCYADELCEELHYAFVSAHAADVVEVKRGRWKFHNDGSGTCDQCHFTQKHIYDDDGWQNFCGVCGADMRERRDNDG